MKRNLNRRDFFKTSAMATVAGATVGLGCAPDSPNTQNEKHGFSADHPMVDGIYSRNFNQSYQGPFLNKLAFPLGGIGTGMVCLEGNGCISHVSVRNTPDVFHEPFMFAAFSIKGKKPMAKVLEGPVPAYKIFGRPNTGNGAGETSYGFPRFKEAQFNTRFPFGTVELQNNKMPVKVALSGASLIVPM